VLRCVQVFNKSSGQFVRQFGSPGSSNGQFQSPYGIAIAGAFSRFFSECIKNYGFQRSFMRRVQAWEQGALEG
jgi:DNA-binding beta-propeller fold protein YncE